MKTLLVYHHMAAGIIIHFEADVLYIQYITWFVLMYAHIQHTTNGSHAQTHTTCFFFEVVSEQSLQLECVSVGFARSLWTLAPQVGSAA